ncbi:hypothetical protein LIER_17074 [Lithospermum erythrorhizon]|uniref:Uncharacterized protein n=1 Tax=Lithospermum erythrorhizon TaxID=34254 RepID=A0AAV3Q9P9_LITER
MVHSLELKKRKKRRYKSPYARHGIQLKERRLAGWVYSSDGVLDDKLCESDFDSEYDDDVEDANAGVFKRIYVCLRSLVDRSKAGCRKLMKLDGFHTKGVHKQQILSVIALDPNNGGGLYDGQ